MQWTVAKEMETTIVGLSGWAQSGKDSTAKVFVEDLGYTKLAFADTLRAVARASNPMVHVRGHAPFGGYATLLHEHMSVEGCYRTDPGGAYEWLKANTTYREFLQNLGTAVRDNLGPLAWVDACMHKVAAGGKYVVTDVRFQNEADAIKARGGQVWRINRANHAPANDHISEHDLDDWNFDRRLSLPNFADDLPALHRALQTLVGAHKVGV